MSVRSRSVADPVRSNNVFMDIYPRGSVKDERVVTRTSRMGLGTIRTLTDGLRMRYGRAKIQILTSVRTSRKNQNKFEKSNNFSVMP